MLGHVKQMVYKEEPTTREDITEQIYHTFRSVDENIIMGMNNCLLIRLRVCCR